MHTLNFPILPLYNLNNFFVVQLGLKPEFHQLDINDKASIAALKNYIKEKHGGLDVLVNNAGIAFKVFSLFKWDLISILLFSMSKVYHTLNLYTLLPCCF